MSDKQIRKYSCPMHPEIVSDKPGKCPKCGGMDLVPMDEMEKGGGHENHDHSMMHGGPEMARDFLRRFLIVTVLLVPLAAFSQPAVEYLGFPDFPLRPFLEFAIATAIFYFGLIFFEHAKHEIKSRQYGMMTLVSVAVGAGYLFSVAATFIPSIDIEFYLEISTLIWVLLFGHFLEAKSSTAAGNALQEVAKLLPKQAHLIIGEGSRDVDIDELKKGDVVRVLSGEKVPADGVIAKGSANFNEAHISGESKPVEKTKGDNVIAGAICIDGSIEVKLDRVGENSTIGQIEKLISQAQQTKPSAQRLADRASKWLTFTALTVALLTLVVWSLIIGMPFVFAMTLAITVLVIACPHALGLAIPTVSTIATRLAVKNGVFIKDMGKLEVVKEVDYVVFDKTGTLTRGEFGVSDVIDVSEGETATEKLSNKQKELLSLTSSLEEHSSHVLGISIVKFTKENGLKSQEARNIKNLAGKGLEGKVGNTQYLVGNRILMKDRGFVDDKTEKMYQRLSNKGKTVAFIADDSQVIGLIALSDKIKSESKKAVEEIHHLGVKVAMLTGDSQEVANGVAKELGIDTVFAQVLPEYKYEHVKSLQSKENKVMMVGDGVNDAPALTQSNVGVAVGAGTDVAVEAGDIVLTRSNPQDIVSLIILSRKVYRKMIENLIWALGYNIIAIPAAAGLFLPFGFRLSPATGALLMSMSSVIVVINAMSLRKAKLEI